jgi:hypothetical protein
MRALRRLEAAQNAMVPHISNDDRSMLFDSLKRELETENWDDSDIALLDQENEQRRRELEAMMKHRKKRKAKKPRRAQLISQV